MKHFKLFAVLSVLVLAIGIIGCKKPLAPLNDGTYTGSGAGRNGDITVSVTVSGGVITDAQLVSESETPEIAAAAEASLLSQFLQKGSTKDLDAVTGATITSNAFIEALSKALSKIDQ